MYANVDGWHFEEDEIPVNERPEMDRWLLSCLNSLIKDVKQCYEDYEPTKAGRLIQAFTVDQVSNWFVRLSKKRFWGNAMSTDKLSAYQTLYTCLETIAKLMSPIAPFYADRLWRDLTSATERGNKEQKESVHLCAFPQADEAIIDAEQEERMRLAQQLTSMILSLRKKEQIVVKQPLQKVAIPATDAQQRERLEAMKQLILDEVNVKEMEFVEAEGVLVKQVKCNFRVMGKKFGALMKNVNAAVQAMTQQQISQLEHDGSILLTLASGDTANVELADVEIFSQDIPGWSVANEGTLTVALDLEISEDLRLEGVARELVRSIQSLRKESGFEITDRIHVTIPASDDNARCLEQFKQYIAQQVLADSICAQGTELKVSKV